MTPEGEFRDAPGVPRGWLDRALARLGGVALLVTVVGGGMLLMAVALFFFSLLLPVVLGAGLIAFVSLWWRMRRLRQAGGEPGATTASGIRFTVLRR